MYGVAVSLRGIRDIEVARYTFATAALAIDGRIEIMKEWILKNKLGVRISAILKPKNIMT